MRLLIDANLSPRLAERLRAAGHDATHVVDHELLRATDEEIAAFAAALGYVVVTADSDFSTNLALQGGAAPSVILLRSAEGLIPAALAALLTANLATVEAELEIGAVVSIRQGRMRVRRLPFR
ncbi:MAG: DUF5615 family PIN-like protein [Bifidobacteriaceae bacterium]|jgi:predicted nuclease of predicted toxin-antitoxin system|nr:DUF5615 family PIN-like protein [Bifidobacteriaceae bacterium]